MILGGSLAPLDFSIPRESDQSGVGESLQSAGYSLDSDRLGDIAV
jgi:hypothetical protein